MRSSCRISVRRRTFWLPLALISLLLPISPACGGSSKSDGGGPGGASDSAASSGDGSGGSSGDGNSAATGSGDPGGSGAMGGTDASASSGGAGPGSGGGAGADDTASGGAGGTGGTDTTGAVGELGGDCDSPGELRCAGNYQKLTLVCSGDGEWETNQTCGAGEFCDSTPGVDQGTCRGAHEDCAEREPGGRYCVDASVYECGPDTITRELLEECAQSCEGGACTEEDCGRVIDGAPSGCGMTEQDCHSTSFDDSPSTTIRLPAASTLCDLCENRAAYVRVGASLGDVFVKVTTEDPWGFAVRWEGFPGSICEVALETCAVLPPWQPADGPRWLAVATPDFDAGPANLHIEVVEEGATCP